MKQALLDITQRIRERSAATRAAYLRRVDRLVDRKRGSDRMGCANVAHAFAAMPDNDKLRIVAERAPHIGIVTAYNDMLSAHQPYEGFPAVIRDEAHRQGATAQVAGGVPAMCDGVTQGLPGMELSLFSRDSIAMGTAIALTHDVFDAALLLGVCDKIVPGLLIGALHFGHLPCVFVPAGPMSSGLSNNAKSKVREQFAQGLVGRDELLKAESAAYHGAGTCTFYGTANSNQMLLEAMGLHVPGAAFVHPHDELREALTRESVRTVLGIAKGQRFTPIGRMVDERVIVNAMVALLATGGSTNHLIHWVAVARAAGILIDWTDFSELSHVTPLLARVYPNGSADVNQFQSAGGPGFVIRELIDSGNMFGDVDSVVEGGLVPFGRVPQGGAEGLRWSDLPAQSGDAGVVRTAAEPFSESGGLKLLTGNLGRSVIKISAVPADFHVIEAPAIVFNAQEELQVAFKAGELNRDFVAVVRFQGPRANGMPELHKLTPPLAVLQGKGFKVALVTDGRMSGASGKVPAAIHLSPEALAGGPLGKVRTGDVIRLDAVAGTLEALVDPATWAAREQAVIDDAQADDSRPLVTPWRPPSSLRMLAIARAMAALRASMAAALARRSDAIDSLSGSERQPPRHGSPPPTPHTEHPMNTLELASYGPVIPVIVINRLEDAVPMAQALVDGGVRVLEVTLRTPIALKCMEMIVKSVPGAIVGAGTVRNVDDAKAAKDVGCQFAVSPGYISSVGLACRDIGLPLLPGTATGSEVMQANADGYQFLKFFPAMQAGGIPMLKAFAGPFPDVAFCPTGGITVESAPQFLALPNVKVCGGSWLTPSDAVDSKDWARITALAKAASALRG